MTYMNFLSQRMVFSLHLLGRLASWFPTLHWSIEMGPYILTMLLEFPHAYYL